MSLMYTHIKNADINRKRKKEWWGFIAMVRVYSHKKKEEKDDAQSHTQKKKNF